MCIMQSKSQTFRKENACETSKEGKLSLCINQKKKKNKRELGMQSNLLAQARISFNFSTLLKSLLQWLFRKPVRFAMLLAVVNISCLFQKNTGYDSR